MDNKHLVNTICKRIYFQDTDAGGVVFYGNFSQYIEIGFAEWFREFVEPLKILTDKYDLFLVVKETHQYFKNSLVYDDEICIRTSLVEVKFFSIQFQTEILMNNQLFYSGNTVLTSVDVHTSKVKKLPEVILRLMKEDSI